ncbi:MAG: FapA family protein, partial [Chloroflexota bacterium]
MTADPPDDANLDKATIRYLGRMGWTITQIAEVVSCDHNTILQVLRDSRVQSGRAPSLPPLTIRLTRDARRLRIVLPADALPVPTAVLLAQIRAHCVKQRINLALTQEELEARLRTCVYGSWLIIGEATHPTAAKDEHIRVLVPVMTGRDRRKHDATAYAVRRGTVLAVREAGVPGEPGKDLLGREIPPRPPRAAPLPQGPNTLISEDGQCLLAACDGMAVLRQLTLHVLPLTVHEGDLRAEDGVLRAEGAIIITGAVHENSTIIAAGDVEVRGDVHSASIQSTTGHIAVAGVVGGTANQPTILRAGGTITCDHVRHAMLHAGIDIVLRSNAHHTRLESTGNVHLPQALDHTLFDVNLSVGGGVIVPVELPPLQSDTQAERRHTRIALAVPAEIARQSPPPLLFAPCEIVDLSPGGARCQLVATPSAEAPVPNALIQLKFVLPTYDDQIVVIARIAHVQSPTIVGVSFMQITERHADLIMQWY